MVLDLDGGLGWDLLLWLLGLWHPVHDVVWYCWFCLPSNQITFRDRNNGIMNKKRSDWSDIGKLVRLLNSLAKNPILGDMV